MAGSLKVTGIAENQRALKDAGKVNTEKAGTEAARNLLPRVKGETRVETGALAGGWEAEKSAFVNNVEYAAFQEFGTVYVEPMNAVAKTVEKNEEVITDAFGKEVDNASRKAGLGR